jgi:excisionase family DNA binding protein
MISYDIDVAGIIVRNLEGAFMPGEELLTVEEVAKELRINAKTVRQYIASGELVAIVVGKGYKISRDDLEDFKRRRRTDQRRQVDKGS